MTGTVQLDLLCRNDDSAVGAIHEGHLSAPWGEMSKNGAACSTYPFMQFVFALTKKELLSKKWTSMDWGGKVWKN